MRTLLGFLSLIFVILVTGCNTYYATTPARDPETFYTSDPIQIQGSRDDAYDVAWETILDLGMTPKYVSYEEGFVTGDYATGGFGAGEEITVFFEEVGENRFVLWMKSRTKMEGETFYEDSQTEKVRLSNKPTDGYRVQKS